MGKQVDRLEVGIRGALEQYNADGLDVIELVERLVQSHQDQVRTIRNAMDQLNVQDKQIQELATHFKRLDLGDRPLPKGGVIMVDSHAHLKMKMVFRCLGQDV